MNKNSKKQRENRPATLPVGTQVKVYGISHEDINGVSKTATVYFKVWQIVKYYPRFVLMQDRLGIRECFTYWELQRRIRPPKRVPKATGGMGWAWE